MWILGLLLALLATPTSASELCGKRADILGLLERSFAEVPVAAGVTENGVVVEILASPTGTWTLLVSFADGISCLVTAGDGWQMKLPAAKRGV